MSNRPDPPEIFPGWKPYPGWAPYCLVCDTMRRMEARDYGWQCACCHNRIGHDLKHYNGDEAGHHARPAAYAAPCEGY